MTLDTASTVAELARIASDPDVADALTPGQLELLDGLAAAVCDQLPDLTADLVMAIVIGMKIEANVSALDPLWALARALDRRDDAKPASTVAMLVAARVAARLHAGDEHSDGD